MGETAEDSRTPSRVPWKRFPPLLVLLAAAIVLMTWPWAKTFASGMIAHWDPPFHAWKLEFAARQLLEGRLLPPDGNTNMYYPYSGAFYFEALHWPEAVIAAILFGLTNAGPVLVYHLTLLFFWALSGVCLWMLLRALGASGVAGLVGALCFTLMPYRMSYRVEFNMQLCFAVPLFLFFFVRFFQRPGVGYACGMAVAWWLQAASELYHAVFLLLVLPFVALAMMRGRWNLLRSWRSFWVPALAAALVGGVLAFVWLWPYTVMLRLHVVARQIKEIRRHVLEPLSYLRPYGHMGVLGVKARHDEMSVYPTVPLMVLSAAYVVLHGLDPRSPTARWRRLLQGTRATALTLFFGIAVVLYGLGSVPRVVSALYSWLPVAICLLSAALLFDLRSPPFRTSFMEGLLASALFAFFMSLGPEILSAPRFSCPNWLFLGLYQRFSALHGFRVVSRFSFFVLLWMTLASAFAIDRALHLKSRGLRVSAGMAVCLLMALFLIESTPRSSRPIEPMPCPLASSVLEGLDRRPDPYVLAIVPMGDRVVDSRHMLQVARYHRLSVYAWGGTYPDYTEQVCRALSPKSGSSPSEAAGLLRKLWPECLVLEDKAFSRASLARPDYAQWLSGETSVEDEDDRFVLLRLTPEPEPAPERVRLVRRDYLAANPQVCFTALAPNASRSFAVWLDLNGRIVGRWDLTGEPKTFRLVLPPELFIRYTPNRLRFHADDDADFLLREFRMEPASKGVPVAPSDSNLLVPWLGMVRELPPGAYPMNVAYRGGLKLLGAEVLDRAASPGGKIRVRCYAMLPATWHALSRLSIHIGFTRNGKVVFESGRNLAELTDMNRFWIGRHDGLSVLDISADVPTMCAAGDEFGLAVTVKNTGGHRLSGWDPAGRKIRRVHLPALVVIAEESLQKHMGGIEATDRDLQTASVSR